MSLMVLTCMCGGVENLSRNVLRRNGDPNYMSTPLYRGRDKSLSALNTIPQFPELDVLRQFLKAHTKYAIVLGYDDKSFRWANMVSAHVDEKIDAELIIDKYK